MSLTYSEIYTTKLREQSKILNGEKTMPFSRKQYVKLIKKFPKKQKSSSWSKPKFKPRRINSKPVKHSNINYNYKPKVKKKTKSKQKLEKSQNQIEVKENDCLQNDNDNNNDNNKINSNFRTYILKSNEFNKNNINSINFNNSTRNKDNNMRNKISLINKNNYNKKNDYVFYNTLQNNNNYNNYIKISKTVNDNAYKNYFDLFRLKQNALSVRDRIRNNYLNKHKSNIDLHTFKNGTNKNNYLKNNEYTDFIPNKTKAFIKAMKYKEEIESSSNYNNNNNQNFISKSSYNVGSDQNNFSSEKVNRKNKNIYSSKEKSTCDNHDIENISFHYFDKSIRKPKKVKKYQNQSNSVVESPDNNNYDSQYKIKNKIKPKKNTFRTKANISVDNNKNNINNNYSEINLRSGFSPKIYIEKYKKEIKNYNTNNIYMNLITQENEKLSNLLKKIPTTRKFRDESFDLLDYISKFNKNKIKSNFSNNATYNYNKFSSIYPVNKCDDIIKIKNNYN